MTANERASELCNRIALPGWGEVGDEVSLAIRNAIHQAILEEREACARIAEGEGDQPTDSSYWVAKKIRSRSN